MARKRKRSSTAVQPRMAIKRKSLRKFGSVLKAELKAAIPKSIQDAIHDALFEGGGYICSELDSLISETLEGGNLYIDFDKNGPKCEVLGEGDWFMFTLGDVRICVDTSDEEPRDQIAGIDKFVAQLLEAKRKLEAELAETPPSTA